MSRLSGPTKLALVLGPVVLLAVGCLLMPGCNWAGSGDKFAEDRDRPLPDPVPFDAKRAMGYLVELCKIGPRVSGSEGMKKQQERLEAHFKKLGGTVTRQKFQARQRSQRQPVEMANLVVAWHPDRPRRVVLCGHYDTRPIADQEPERSDWTKPFVSANDGTSTAAWMMELAHHMKDFKAEVGVDFVLFDGEEYIFDNRRQEAGGDRYFFGSEHFARDYRANPPAHKYVAGVNLDLFAGKDARFPVEQNSKFHAGRVVEEVWKTANRLGVKSFRAEEGPDVLDDHIALNQIAKIPTIDVIDFDYEHWHRLSDTPENCSAETMGDVARVLTVWIQRQK